MSEGTGTLVNTRLLLKLPLMLKQLEPRATAVTPGSSTIWRTAWAELAPMLAVRSTSTAGPTVVVTGKLAVV